MHPSPELQTLLTPLVERFADSGFRLYLVGGIVRDLVAGHYRPGGSDIDLTTDAAPDDIKRIAQPLARAVWTQGERFGTIGVQLVDPTGEVHDVEVTTHRAESYVPDSRNPKVVFGTELREDLSRRDFTVNAMAIELLAAPGAGVAAAELRDPFEGRIDLAEGVLRTPLSPEVSFGDDPLRMLRAARFMARFGLDPLPALEAAASAMAERLAIVSVERVADEVERLLAVADPSRGLAFLNRTGLLRCVVGVDVDAEQAIAAASVPIRPPPESWTVHIRRAALLWSVAEPGSVLSRLRYSNDDRRATVALIDAVRNWHWSPGQPDGERLADARRAVHTVTSVGLSHHDLIGLVESLSGAGVDVNAALIRRQLGHLVDTNDLGPYVSPLSGSEVMTVLGVEPGPVVGRAQRYLKSARITGGPLSTDEAERLLVENRRQLEQVEH